MQKTGRSWEKAIGLKRGPKKTIAEKPISGVNLRKAKDTDQATKKGTVP